MDFCTVGIERQRSLERLYRLCGTSGLGLRQAQLKPEQGLVRRGFDEAAQQRNDPRRLPRLRQRVRKAERGEEGIRLAAKRVFKRCDGVGRLSGSEPGLAKFNVRFMIGRLLARDLGCEAWRAAGEVALLADLRDGPQQRIFRRVGQRNRIVGQHLSAVLIGIELGAFRGWSLG